MSRIKSSFPPGQLQCSSVLILRAPWPVYFRYVPALTHMIQTVGSDIHTINEMLPGSRSALKAGTVNFERLRCDIWSSGDVSVLNSFIVFVSLDLDAPLRWNTFFSPSSVFCFHISHVGPDWLPCWCSGWTSDDDKKEMKKKDKRSCWESTVRGTKTWICVSGLKSRNVHGGYSD